MTARLRPLGLGLAVACAIGAMGASSASAVTHTFHTDGPLAHLTAEADGESQQVIYASAEDEAEGNSIRCSEISATGTVEGTHVGEGTYAADRIAVEPHYSGCGAYNGAGEKLINVTVDSTGCRYKFTGPTNANGDAPLHIEEVTSECESGITFTIVGVPCLHLKPTQTLSGVHYSNVTTESGVEELTINITADNVESTTTNRPLIGCPTESGETATDIDGTYSGKISLRAFKDVGHTEQTDLTVNPG